MPIWYLIPAALMLGLWGVLHCQDGGIFHQRARRREQARDRAELQAEIDEAIARAVTDETGRAL